MAVALVVACTNRKSRPVVVRLGRIRQKTRATSTARLFDAWATVLDDRSTAGLPAQELYSGVSWSASRDAGNVLDSLETTAERWVLSAGYGLVRWQQSLVPYAATFSPGHADAVAKNDSEAVRRRINTEWSAHLSTWRPKDHLGPRSFRELAGAVDAMMIVMSPRYLDAAGGDLVEAAASVRSCVVISGGLRRTHPLMAYAVPFDKRLRETEEVTGVTRLVDASDMSLNQRVAEHLLLELGVDAFDLKQAGRYIAAAMRARRRGRTYEHRRPAKDSEVSAFIEAALLADPEESKTRLLQRWRQEGRQCEQKRFGRIFDDTKAAIELAGVEISQGELPL